MAMSSQLALSGVVDWEALTGQSRFVIELVTFPIFSAIAGVLTNWTGVLMLFAPEKFHGFHMPGLERVYPLFPRKVQVLPCWRPGGIMGFQAIIVSRAEKMASMTVDQTLAKIGKLSEIMGAMEPEKLEAYLVSMARRDLRPLVTELMETEHPQLWRDLPGPLREIVFEKVDEQLPDVVHRAMDTIMENIDLLIDPKLLAVGYLRKHPEILKEMLLSVGKQELNFMIKIGLLGAPFGLILAFLVHLQPSIPVASALPTWLFILTGAAIIGFTVNVLAIKVIFTPGEPKPRYKCLWKQAMMAKRQDEAALDLGQVLAYRVLTIENIADDLLNGPRGDKARMLIAHQVRKEIETVVGAVRPAVRVAVGAREFDALERGSAVAAVGFAPKLYEDAEFTAEQSKKISDFAGQKLKELPPDEFMDILLSAIEQDAWLLYAHGGLLGVMVGTVHLFLFGA